MRQLSALSGHWQTECGPQRTSGGAFDAAINSFVDKNMIQHSQIATHCDDNGLCHSEYSTWGPDGESTTVVDGGP